MKSIMQLKDNVQVLMDESPALRGNQIQEFHSVRVDRSNVSQISNSRNDSINSHRSNRSNRSRVYKSSNRLDKIVPIVESKLDNKKSSNHLMPGAKYDNFLSIGPLNNRSQKSSLEKVPKCSQIIDELIGNISGSVDEDIQLIPIHKDKPKPDPDNSEK